MTDQHRGRIGLGFKADLAAVAVTCDVHLALPINSGGGFTPLEQRRKILCLSRFGSESPQPWSSTPG
jgi:hypothetical protein